ncbi:MAG: histidine phosphatase family protein [Actinomycetota bacterium]|nr:histidine phosphatase family protein [Actinomycetota bacterium]
MLLRHGASAPFVPGTSFPLVEGQGDPPLSDAGQVQALSSAERLAGEPIGALYATSMQRTQQTVAPLATRLGLEVGIEPSLREVHLGDWEGGLLRQHAAAGHPIYEQMHVEERWDVIPGAESNETFGGRCLSALERIADRHPDQLVLCGVHGGVIGVVLAQIANARPFAFGGADNCSISQIVRIDGAWTIRRFNDSSHLHDALHHG